MDKDIQNRATALSTTIPPAFGEISLVNFGLLIAEISIWNHTTHPNRILRKTIFQPLRGAAPPNFFVH